ncbi:MAG: phosphoribosylformylglycinamidine synthase subunit PurL [Nitrososphaerales archaeon]
MSLTHEELVYLKNELKRQPNEVELSIVEAEWSEHCSYKSSKPLLKLLPTQGKRVLLGPGYDAGVLDVGDGYVITVHIESHNHPSAVEPYGGAATGVGGVIRDILSMGTRPIAVLDALRFGNIEKDSHARWLFRHVVRGISDYGNCLGIPTVGGEVEFDPSFENYCLVDVASVGLGKKEDIITTVADNDDYVVLAGGSTGRDGIHGASFASKALEEENRSAVQIPDPFLEKLLIEATMDAVNAKCIKAVKDLGGGGLSCCLSETADKIGKGIDVDISKVHVREQGMTPRELMISESQERMLYVVDESHLAQLLSIHDKYEISYSVIGKVKDHGELVVRYNSNLVAKMPASLVANAPLANRTARKPAYIDELASAKKPALPSDVGESLLKMLSNPTIASKRWIYQQYDHEVGVRTVVKPGYADASVLRLDNGKFLAVKLDGNSKHCYLDPYNGAMGCFAEACRNVIAVGAEPIGMVDHLQFGSPEDPEIFWTFTEALKGISDYGKALNIPCVGGKVSFYNEGSKGTIKPSPVIGVLGLIDNVSWIKTSMIGEGDILIIVGITKDEMGGSEYYEYVHSIVGGNVPKVDPANDYIVTQTLLKLIRNGFVNSVHDCSKGGLAVALAEMCILSNVGADIDTSKIPNECSRIDDLLFSESHSRFILSVESDKLGRVTDMLESKNVTYGIMGKAQGNSITFSKNGSIANVSVDKAEDSWVRMIEGVVEHG